MRRDRSVLNEAPQFRVPNELKMSDTAIRRALVVGSCFSEAIAHQIHRVFKGGAVADHITYNFAGELPDRPPRPVAEYAFQVVVLPLRTVMPETMFMALAWDDFAGYERCYSHSERVLIQLLTGALVYNERHGVTTFVTNFLAPQANSMGRLFKPNDIRNPAHFVRRLNEVMADLCALRTNVYVVDVDELAANMGKRFIQDDVLESNSHGVFLSDWDWHHDRGRLHPPAPISSALRLAVDEFNLALWTEVEAMYRTLKQQDSVKIVICDLDDTLWRGVVAEDGVDGPHLIEGWPLGLIEALTFLKRRGILLAIASKNDERLIRELWPRTVGDRLPLDQFAIVKINWRSKAENVGEILKEASLLARNALFIDDNPVERQSVKDAYPDIRLLGSDLYSIRRILLWAPETQVASVSAESARRTEMIQAQVVREHSREALPREEFLASLGVKATRITIRDRGHSKFPRSLELINKSNQFNTTGERWTAEQAHQFFTAGGRFEACEVTDKFTEYGLVGVAVVEGDTVRQYVMSCRVLGLDVEHVFMQAVTGDIAASHGRACGTILVTETNILARDLFSRIGFAELKPGVWLGPSEPGVPIPGHIELISAKPPPVASVEVTLQRRADDSPGPSGDDPSHDLKKRNQVSGSLLGFLGAGSRSRFRRAVAQGDKARDVGSWETAITRYREALRARRDLGIGVQLGHVLKETRQFGEAEAHYRAFLDAYPTDADIHLQIGHLLTLQARRDAARPWYEKALALSPAGSRLAEHARASLSHTVRDRPASGPSTTEAGEETSEQGELKIHYATIDLASIGEVTIATDANENNYFADFIRTGFHLSEARLLVYELFDGHRDREFIDLGANVGTFAIPLAKAGVRTLAVEAHPANFVCLAQGLRRSGLSNAVPVHAAVFARTDVLPIGGHSAWGHILRDGENAGSAIPVPAMKLTDLMEIYGFSNPYVLKIDVEGAERDVFRSMSEVLEGGLIEHIVFESHVGACEAYGYSSADLFGILSSAGYQIYGIWRDKLFPFLSGPQPFVVLDFLASRRPLKGTRSFRVGELTDEDFCDLQRRAFEENSADLHAYLLSLAPRDVRMQRNPEICAMVEDLGQRYGDSILPLVERMANASS
jgi:FkbH-like protein/FkbM family methyltransferase